MKKNTMLQKQGERGSARLKFIIVMVVLAIVAYAGYLYVPVAYDAYYFKDVMQNKVDIAATQGYEISWVTDQLVKSRAEYHVPENAIITPTQKDNRVEVRVQFTRPIQLPGYTYNYDFDYTAKSTAFLAIK
jgi:flagellar basal body-associated protein FliL